MNNNGQYNLNFIDWSNETEAILDWDPDSGEVPIEGMDREVFEEVYSAFHAEDEREQGVKGKKLIDNLTHKTVTKT